MTSPEHLEHIRPQLDWDSAGRPISKRYNDFYFSTQDAIAECRHVFLDNNQLPDRWRSLTSDSKFTIGEAGFGSGLNFLCCWQAWQTNAPSGAQLHYISVEKHPLSKSQLSDIFLLWPELDEFSAQLLIQYPAAHCGVHRLHFPEQGVTLTLLLGDAEMMLEQINMTADCWFLDGFAPSKNSQMWHASLLNLIASKSKPGTTFSTYTVANLVRKNLVDAGFEITRTEGFGNKREGLRGCFTAADNAEKPYFPPWSKQPGAAHSERRVTIIGAGMAGCSCALAMARRGWQVTLLESNSAPAQEASGNPQGILYSKLSAHGTELSELVHQGFHFSLAMLQQLLPPEQHQNAWSPCGVIQLAHSSKELERHLSLCKSDIQHDEFFTFQDADQLSEIAGVRLDHPGLYFSKAGWVNPASFCEKILQHPNIKIQTDWQLIKLERSDDATGWHLHNQRGECLTSGTVILTSGKETHQLSQSGYLPIKAIRGQISYLAETNASSNLNTVLCGESYIAPARLGRHNFGATFNFDSTSRECRDIDHQHNLGKLEMLSSELYQQLDASLENLQGGRANFRCTTPDYLPLVGALVDNREFVERFSLLRKDANYRFTDDCPFLPGLYVSSAHGSRGLISCPLSGEILASMICNDPSPISNRLRQALNPNRFLLRQLIRRQL